jgi:hypothetical protein
MTLRVTETKHGKGLWKMNFNITTSELFQKAFRGFWKYWQEKKKEYSDIGKWWDMGKRKIKELTISVARELTCKRKETVTKLEEFILKAQENIPLMELQKNELEEAKRNLKEILEYKGEGARVRSRVNWHEEGENSSSYFFNLEKRNAKDKAWERILDTKGNMLTGIQNILETQVNFYSELYKSQIHEQIGNDKFLDSIDRKLNSNINTVLEKEISMKELGEALKKMKINKSPGPDGIVTEFYKFYWQEIGNDLTEVFQNSFKSENLPQSQYLAAIRLVFKKGQRENLKNWRPISLLNTDVKILSKLLSERLKIALPNLIHKDQTGCIQGRYIGENICLIKDIINQCDEDESILLIDQEKAFDRVEFEWLFQVLKTFGFGRNFITWLKIMYKSMKSCIITNGYISKVFPVSRGIRQGDSLSALLYILQSEPLAAYLRKTNRIQGIEINIMWMILLFA